MDNTKRMLTAADISRMYKEIEARHPKAMKHIRYKENFKKRMYATK